jgi:hypothetical protein
MIDRELARMIAGTRMPERLREIFGALHDDPFLIRECLARATLVDRLSRSFFAFDDGVHGDARARAERMRRDLLSGRIDPSAPHPDREVLKLHLGSGSGGHDPSTPGERGVLRLDLAPEEHRRLGTTLPARLGDVGAVVERRDAFVVSILLSEDETGVRVARFVARKSRWDAWWRGFAAAISTESVVPVAKNAPLPAVASAPACLPDDTWDNASLGAPVERYDHTAIWTGTEMIVWGGSGPASLNTGGRYDPVSDTWTPTSMTGVPPARVGHTAVWTSSKMVVWGGLDAGGATRTGGRYDPMTDTWSPTATLGAATGRYDHTTVWTGSRMLV